MRTVTSIKTHRNSSVKEQVIEHPTNNISSKSFDFDSLSVQLNNRAAEMGTIEDVEQCECPWEKIAKHRLATCMNQTTRWQRWLQTSETWENHSRNISNHTDADQADLRSEAINHMPSSPILVQKTMIPNVLMHSLISGHSSHQHITNYKAAAWQLLSVIPTTVGGG